jgi:hypothetical protein
MSARAACTLCLAVLLPACVTEYDNPFQIQDTKPLPPEADVVLAVSRPEAPALVVREVATVDLDVPGAPIVVLTSCFKQVPLCDIEEIAVAPDRARVAVRRRQDTNNDSLVSPTEEQHIFVMDLSRSIEGEILDTVSGITALQWTTLETAPLLFSATGEGSLDDVFGSLPDGTEVQNLTLSANLLERQPRFEPGIIAYERITPGERSEIWISSQILPEARLTSADASLPKISLPGTPHIVGGDADPDPSPDGGSVVFRRLTGPGTQNRGHWDLWTVDIFGNDLQVLTSGPAFRSAPDWGPRGVLFVEIADGATSAEVVLIANDGSRSVLFTAPSTATAPRWLR